MSRIAECFARLKQQGRAALIPFVTAGDPDPQATVPIMRALVEAGADVIELGVPFSDPMADGPVIQRASERALKHGVGLKHVLAMVREFRAGDSGTPVVLMGYGNPIERMGEERFCDAAAEAGVDGVLVVDFPPEEGRDLNRLLKARGIDPIFLLSPTSSPERIQRVAAAASGYLYYVSLKGVTGAAHLDLDDVAAHLPAIKARAGLPVGVGFGIRDGATAARVAAIADAVVIGSRLVQEIEDAPPGEAASRVKAVLAEVRSAMDRAIKPVA